MEMAKMFLGLWTQGPTKKRRDQDRCQKIDELLDKLQRKQERLEEKLAREHHSSTRRHLRLAVEVVRLQRKKGLAQRMELLGDTE